jgi:hypothetical protein
LFATKNAACLGRGRHYDAPANRFVHPPPRLVRLGFSGFLDALLISTTDFGWSLRGVVNTKPGGHVCPRAKLINGFFENARVGVRFNLHVCRQASESQTNFMDVCRNTSE